MPTEAITTKRSRGELYWLLAITLAGVVVYAPTFRFFWEKWIADVQYSLAFLVPFVCGYFTWKKWPEVRLLERAPTAWGLVLMIFALMLHLAGLVLDISGPSGISLILCIIGGCLYFHGKALVRTLAFPLAYTLFMVPVPNGVLDAVGFPLQMWASGSTAAMLNLVGMDVTRNGVNLSVPGFDFQVAVACAGMSSLVALVGVTAVFAYITRLPAALKWLVFFLAIPIALAANVVRITTIALSGYWFGPKIAMRIFHEWSSPILFLAAILLLFAINGVLEWLCRGRTTC